MLCKLAFLSLFIIFGLTGELPLWVRKIMGNAPDLESGVFAPPVEFLNVALKGFLPETSGFSLISILLTTSVIFGSGIVVAIIFILLAFWKGRLFCSYVCPLGTCLELQAKYLPNAKKRFALKWNGIIFWTTIFSAILGIPLFLFFDPLSIFNRGMLFLNPPVALPALLLAGMLLFIFILGFIKPMFWCADLCPMGYLYIMLGKIKSWKWKKKNDDGQKKKENVSTMRRDVISGLAFGVPAALLVRNFGLTAKRDDNIPVLPPGAGSSTEFHPACSRCYACVNACPTKVLTVRMPTMGDSFASYFAPALFADHAACPDSCNKCTQVCPTGAINKLTLEIKNRTQMGIAQVDKTKCLAWAKDENCVVCDEYCPYSAFNFEEQANGIPCPIVKEDVCRGCGFCQSACPVREPGPAIRVKGVREQRLLDEDNPYDY